MVPPPKRLRTEDSLLKIHASLRSGQGEAEIVSVWQSDRVGYLKQAVQKALGRLFLRLIMPDGRHLDDLTESVQLAGLRNGDTILAISHQPKVATTCRAFALWYGAGQRAVTWGPAEFGGDSSDVRGQLKNVRQIRSNWSAFAAILADGTVVTWGNPYSGGCSSEVKSKLRNVEEIHASQHAFAAILADRTVVTWGNDLCGADSSAVQAQLQNVVQIHATRQAFAAVLADGSVVTWGTADYGGDSSRVRYMLHNVQEIHATDGAFAALLADGSVVTWGRGDHGGHCDAGVQDQLRNVRQICANCHAFAAILPEGDPIVTWGCSRAGGDSSGIRDRLRNVQRIHGTDSAFAAILADGSVETWGSPTNGGDSSNATKVQPFVGTCEVAAARSCDDRTMGDDAFVFEEKKPETEEESRDKFAACTAKQAEGAKEPLLQLRGVCSVAIKEANGWVPQESRRKSSELDGIGALHAVVHAPSSLPQICGSNAHGAEEDCTRLVRLPQTHFADRLNARIAVI
eukprot:Skav220919  [mRNA]  locus=scaffold1145:168511:174393:+ [translate_table: standard]